MIGQQGRHLSADGFRDYLTAGVPIDHPIEGSPRLVLFIDPTRPRIGLRAPAGNGVAPATGLEHISAHVVHFEGHRYLELAVTDRRLFVDAYPVLCAVADRIQLDGMTFQAAVTETLRHLGHLLRAEDTLSRETETGLIGELALLAGMIKIFGPDIAVAAWRGGQGEEHDFGLPDTDIEVKTTTSERRVHWISSLTQLVATGGRPLHLVSIQITRAGTDGVTVNDLIERIRAATGSARDRFDTQLVSAGWRERYVASATQQWRGRHRPAVFIVDDQFPRITPDLLGSAGVDLTVVTEVRYHVDLTSRPSTVDPEGPIEDVVNAAYRELT